MKSAALLLFSRLEGLSNLLIMSEYDNELLAKLYRESNILKCKTNQVKRDKWKKIAEQYCTEKNIELIDQFL